MAVMAERDIGQMLAEQDIDVMPDARLIPQGFTTPKVSFDAMTATISDADQAWMEQFAASLVQDAARAAEQVATAVRPDIYHVRYVSPPCCSRCAVLAGRVYRWSQGFERHPGCDCVMLPTTVAAPFAQDPEQLVRDGQVHGLSKADLRAVEGGADLSRVVNVRRRAAGLRESGRVLSRAGKPTPEAIYRAAGDDRAAAIELLRQHGYVRT